MYESIIISQHNNLPIIVKNGQDYKIVNQTELDKCMTFKSSTFMLGEVKEYGYRINKGVRFLILSTDEKNPRIITYNRPETHHVILGKNCIVIMSYRSFPGRTYVDGICWIIGQDKNGNYNDELLIKKPMYLKQNNDIEHILQKYDTVEEIYNELLRL